MSLNLLDIVKDQVTGQLAKQASSFLGESESSVAKALGGLMPALLGSTINKASNPSGAQGIMDTISKLDLDSLSNIAGMFGGGSSQVDGLLNSGGGIVDMLMGNKSSGVIDVISKMAGIKSGSSSSLLKMAAPFLMGIIGKQIKGKGISALTDLLFSQKNHVQAALPSELNSVLSLGNLGTNIPKVEANATNWIKWLLPVLLGGALIYYFANKGCGNKITDATTAAVETVGDAATNIGDAAANAAESVSNLFKKTLSSGFELVNASNDGVESQLITFIDDASKQVDKETWFNFDRLLFDTGKATLQASSQEQLNNVAEILKAYPNVKVKIGGYTDNVGDPKANLRLSTDRAFNVMNALVGLGVDKARLAAEGYGENHAIADNSTEEGRQQNRRIAVRVTEK